MKKVPGVDPMYSPLCLRFAQPFPLSAKAKRGILLAYNDLHPLLYFSREGGRGDEYVCKTYTIKGIIDFLFFGYSWKCSLYHLCEVTALGKRFAKVKIKNASPGS